MPLPTIRRFEGPCKVPNYTAWWTEAHRCEQLAQGCCPNNAAVGVELTSCWSRVRRATVTPPSHLRISCDKMEMTFTRKTTSRLLWTRCLRVARKTIDSWWVTFSSDTYLECLSVKRKFIAQCPKTWNPKISPWTKQSLWLRIVHCGDWCLRLALCSPRGACHKRIRRRSVPMETGETNIISICAFCCCCQIWIDSNVLFYTASKQPRHSPGILWCIYVGKVIR